MHERVIIEDGGPAFPSAWHPVADGYTRGDCGMSLRDYFAIRAPEPTDAAVQHVAERERLANPHGDSYKPMRRSAQEIRCAIRYEFADAMLHARLAQGSR